MQRGWGRSLGLGLALVLTAGLSFGDPMTISARPGTLNYLEGQASIDDRPLTGKSVRSAQLQKGQVLETGQGNVELLLTPGVFLRLGNGSSLRMISPGLADTQVELLNGSAMLEVDELYHQNNLDVAIDGTTTHIGKKGLYEFAANPPLVQVFQGKAEVFDHGRRIAVKGDHELALAANGPLKARSFDKREVEQDPLYRWSKLRSQYEAEATAQMAQNVYVNGGWYGPGWYWAPYWGFYSYVPYGGFYDPFGFGFWGPGFAWGGYPVIVGGVHRAPGSYHWDGHRTGVSRGPAVHPEFHGGRMGGRR